MSKNEVCYTPHLFVATDESESFAVQFIRQLPPGTVLSRQGRVLVRLDDNEFEFVDAERWSIVCPTVLFFNREDFEDWTVTPPDLHGVIRQGREIEQQAALLSE